MKLVLASALLLAATAAALTEGTRRLFAEPPEAPAATIPVEAPAGAVAAETGSPAAGGDVRVVYPTTWAVTSVPRQATADARPVGAPPDTSALKAALGQASGARLVKTIPIGPPGAQPPAAVGSMPPAANAAPRIATPSIAAPEPPADVQVLAKEFDAPPAPPLREPKSGRGLVDLNSAPLAALDGLGAGKIGRAIVRGRPYADAEDLLTRRVLKRSTFERIKDQIEAR